MLAAWRNGANGAENSTVTVWGSTTFVPVYGPSRLEASCDLVAGSWIRSKLTLTASASNGVPSWKTTSLRSLKV